MTYEYRVSPNDYKKIQDFVENELSAIKYPAVPINACYGFMKSRPTVDRVIFNSPATIIFWTDGTKTVVKCQPGDTYDEEKGFMAAYLKKLLGNDNTFNKEIKKYCIAQYVKED